MKDVTVIVPVYNAGKNIDHCVNSLLNQTSKNFKVLLINDGSKDDSLDRIKKVEKEHPDIFRVLDQENKGVVETRHRGIKESDTKYIMFMDNDDFIDSDYIEKLYNEIETSGMDIVISGYRRANFERVIFTVPSEDDEWTKYRITAPWARIFKRKFLVENDVKFLETYIGEDTYFNISAYQYTNKIKSINYIGYNWYYNNESVSNTKQKGLKKECDVLVVLKEIDKIVKDKNDKLLNYFMVRHIVWYLLFSGKYASSERFVEEYNRLFEWLKKSNYKNKISIFSKKIKSEPINNRIYISIFLLLSKLNLIPLFAKIYCKGQSNEK